MQKIGSLLYSEDKDTSYYIDKSDIRKDAYAILIASLKHEPDNLRSGSKLHFINRSPGEMNLVAARIYDLRSTSFIYIHFITKYIYQQVIISYWWPINFLIILLVTLITFIMILHIKKEVIQPLQFMAGIAHYLLVPDQKDKSEKKLRKLIKN